MMPPSEERELRPDASTPAGQPYSGLGPLTSEILLSSCPVDPWSGFVPTELDCGHNCRNDEQQQANAPWENGNPS